MTLLLKGILHNTFLIYEETQMCALLFSDLDYSKMYCVPRCGTFQSGKKLNIVRDEHSPFFRI